VAEAFVLDEAEDGQPLAERELRCARIARETQISTEALDLTRGEEPPKRA